MKLPWSRSVLALVAAVGATLGAPAQATVIASNVVTVATPVGSITVVSTVDDAFPGDPSRWLFQYQVSGDYEPHPPDTNGISSLQIVFGGLVPDVASQTGPVNWDANSTSVAPPFGAGWDRPNSVEPGPENGDYLFSFTVPAGTAFTSEDQGSYAGSHYLDVPYGLVSLVDAGHGLIVPVPEPTSLFLLGGGLALLARRRLISAK